MIRLARDELRLKEDTVKELAASTKMMEKSMQSIADSIESLRLSLGSGLALLARARTPPSAVPHSVPQNYSNTFQTVAPSATCGNDGSQFSHVGITGHDWGKGYSY